MVDIAGAQRDDVHTLQDHLRSQCALVCVCLHGVVDIAGAQREDMHTLQDHLLICCLVCGFA